MNKLAMRRAWFQVHKWIGLILAVLIIPLSVTGAALVWDETLDHGLNPRRYAVSGGSAIDPQLYLDAAKSALQPGEIISSMSHIDGGPIVITASQPAKPGKGAQAGPPARTTIWLDPPTARVLDVQRKAGGLIRVMHNIHGQLMVPGIGRQIVGWIGVAMAFSCFTGLWLWWPTVGRWVRGFRWRRHRNLDTNLHHVFGFWVTLPLFVLSLTGIWISFPQVFGGGQPRGAGPGAARPQPLAAPKLSLDAVISRLPAQFGDMSQITWPTDQNRVWKLTLDERGLEGVVDDNGRYTWLGPPPPETTARLMRRIHDGTRMGPVWQMLIFLGGLIPAILAVTGIVMWWRARSWKGELKARQRAKMA